MKFISSKRSQWNSVFSPNSHRTPQSRDKQYRRLDCPSPRKPWASTSPPRTEPPLPSSNTPNDPRSSAMGVEARAPVLSAPRCPRGPYRCTRRSDGPIGWKTSTETAAGGCLPDGELWFDGFSIMRNNMEWGMFFSLQHWISMSLYVHSLAKCWACASRSALRIASDPAARFSVTATSKRQDWCSPQIASAWDFSFGLSTKMSSAVLKVGR